MTTAVRANPLHQIEDSIAEGAPALIPVIANVVRQYLFPDQPKGWITEWSGAHGHHVMTKAVKTATRLTPDIVHVIVEYLRKNDIFELEDVEKAAGGKAELAELIGPYNTQVPLPLEIDDEMQAPLSRYFDAETLRDFHEYRIREDMPEIIRMTELYSLYWGSARMTPNIAEKLAMKHGTQFYQHSWEAALLEHGDRQIAIDCWIAFPNDVFGRIKTFQEQEALIPPGFEFSHFPEAVFCPFVRYACTRERIMSEEPLTSTLCPEETQGNKLRVGRFGADGLCVTSNRFNHVISGANGFGGIQFSSSTAMCLGVAPVRKFYAKGNQSPAFLQETQQRQLLGLDPNDHSPSEPEPTVPSPRIEQALGNEGLAPLESAALEPVIQAGEPEEPAIDNPLEPQDEPIRELTLWEETVAVFTAIVNSIVGWFCWFAKLLRSAFETT